jgi:CheY-like chemotaxis protein
VPSTNARLDGVVDRECPPGSRFAEGHQPDVVLLDLRTQDEEVVQYFRQRTDLGTALVAVTVPGEEAALRLADHGFTHYLIEPVDPAQVQALLKKLTIPR